MEENVDSKFGRFLTGAMFFGVSILVGMQIATGQVPQVQTLSGLGDKPAANAAAGTAAAPNQANAPAAPPAPADQNKSAVDLRNSNYIPASEAIKQMPAIMQEQGELKPLVAPVQPKQFVPSVVEAYLPPVIKHVEPEAILKTTLGDIKIKLHQINAPVTVANFMALARGEKSFVDVRSGKKVTRPFYNGLVFHRVVPGFLVQAGCPFGTGRGDPGYSLADEITPQLRFEKAGMVAMAPARNAGAMVKDSNGSQFFITLAPLPVWNDQYTIFGEVESGMDVVRKIAASKIGPTDRPIRRVFIQSVDIIDENAPAQPPDVPVPSASSVQPAPDASAPLTADAAAAPAPEVAAPAAPSATSDPGIIESAPLPALEGPSSAEAPGAPPSTN